MPEQSQLSPALAEKFLAFMEYANPARLNRNLRGLLLTTLMSQKDGFIFNLDDLFVDIIQLFELLDAMEDGKDQKH